MPAPGPPATQAPSPNFGFLAYHDAHLAALAAQAEQVFPYDAIGCIVRLRAFGERLAKLAAAKVALLTAPADTQAVLVGRLHDDGAITWAQKQLFDALRKIGNDAAHEGRGTHRDALELLKIARELAVWFQRAFGNNKRFDPGPFVPPEGPDKPDRALTEELSRLRAEAGARKSDLEAARREAEEAKRAAEREAEERLSAEERAQKARDEAQLWEALATEYASSEERAKQTEAELSALRAVHEKLVRDLERLQADAAKAPPEALRLLVERSAEASCAIVIDEATTRRLIDVQLREAGWEADSESLTFARGARPAKGKNLAIAEWPTKGSKGHPERADYALFVGLLAVGVIEAKAEHKDVSAVIEQAKRYSRGFLEHGAAELPAESPWGEYRVPFLFATNGRPYLRQLKEKSGIWFLDARRKQNLSLPLVGFCTPEGLSHRLKQDIDKAHEALAIEPMPYIDRDYQRRAILSVEKGLAEGRREMLVAMATGTGKTRTCIGLCYRLIKTKRFRRILFLVDRNALGRQTADALKDLRLENLQTFPDIYDVKELGDLKPDADTRLQIATVQAMVRRVLGAPGSATEPEPVPVDLYDCIIVDECHRGYLLDREMSDREMSFRDEADYISKYRRVLDCFDAVKIGLTATPALHTKEIFGAPITKYTFTEAVMDGFLVDEEPPIRIITRLAKDGIHYKAHEEVLVLDRQTGALHTEDLPDDVDFEIESFNRQVLNENFNRAVLAEVTRHIDPEDDEKTLVFCVSDEHADRVVRLFKEELRARYGAVEDDAVMKITGEADRPLEKIRRFRNERHPSIAVTVDLLTTGIDVPKIANLVFLRRVRSRVLYEQMLGRATRLCPEIGKERFRVFDAVDLCRMMRALTDMKPVVVNPKVRFEALAKEVISAANEDDARASLGELLAKLQRKKRAITGPLEERFATAAGQSVAEVLSLLKNAPIAEAARWLNEHPAMVELLDRSTEKAPRKAIVSDHEDSVIEVSRGYGDADRPEDYLESFSAFLKDNLNKVPALVLVTQRPRELTRQDLRSLKLLLDEKGFRETALQTAWRESKNEDIAAGIIGHIRQLALGSPLVSYAERVDGAVRRILKAHKLTDPQRKWLHRIAEQVKLETVVDRTSLDSGQFQAQGGFARLNKIFDGKLEELLGELSFEVWNDVG